VRAGCDHQRRRTRRFVAAQYLCFLAAHDFHASVRTHGPAHLLGPDTLFDGYPATPEGQTRYMTDITQTVISNGRVGVVYWEPAWVWENATFFDFQHNNELLPAALHARHTYQWLQPVTFRFESAPERMEQLYLWADFFGSRQFVASVPRSADGAFVYETRLRPGQDVHFQIYDRVPLGDGLLAPTDARTRAVLARVQDGPTTLSYRLSR
jgi:arabinogalactan endo-1,4-beta-galactosidase